MASYDVAISAKPYLRRSTENVSKKSGSLPTQSRAMSSAVDPATLNPHPLSHSLIHIDPVSGAAQHRRHRRQCRRQRRHCLLVQSPVKERNIPLR